MDHKLIAQKFLNDDRVQKSIREILLCLTEHQQALTGIKAADPDLEKPYQELMESFGKMRSGALFIPYLGSGLGNGALVELADGSVKYDFITGIGVHYFGHSHPKITEALLSSALSDTVMQGNLQQNTDSVDFVSELLNAANATGANFEHCFLTSSGVMAGENAFKIAFQKHAPAHRMLAFKGCFMGRTITLSQVTDRPKYREGLPKTLEVDYVPFFDHNKPKESTAEAINTLKAHLQNHPGEYAAMNFELVIGEGGFYPGQSEFFRELMTIVKESGVAVLVDEVQTFARTTQPFAFQHFGLEDLVDVVWIGKASQACATLFRADYKPKPGLLSQTYTASSSAIAAGHTMLKELLTNGYYGKDGKIAKIHEYFVDKFQSIAKKHPNLLTGPYGIGAMIGFTPLDGSLETVKALNTVLFQNGVMGFMCGSEPMRYRFLVPVGAVSFEDIDVVCGVLEKSLIQVAESR